MAAAQKSWYPTILRSYFERQDAQERALNACRNFLGAKHWAVADRLRLYEASQRAFSPFTPAGDALLSFRQVYDELVRPAPAGGWGIARNAAGPLWSAEKTFTTLITEFSSFPWGGPVNLSNFRNGAPANVIPCLQKMKDLKPLTSKSNWPVMAISKLLHFYNPEFFPVYDNEVIWNKVLTCFKNEFRQFCLTFSPPYDEGYTTIFYRNYICFGTSLLQSAHSGFMAAFAEWLGEQPGAELASRHLEPVRLFATAYEFVIIGAYAYSSGN